MIQLLTLARTFSKDAGLTSEKHIRKTSCRCKEKTTLETYIWVVRKTRMAARRMCLLLSVGRKGVEVGRNLLDLKRTNKRVKRSSKKGEREVGRGEGVLSDLSLRGGEGGGKGTRSYLLYPKALG